MISQLYQNSENSNPYQGRIAPKSPLICSNVAEGHSKAVLSVFATDELLFRYAIWLAY